MSSSASQSSAAERWSTGIAQSFAQAGYQVVLCDTSEQKLGLALHSIRRNLAAMARVGILAVGEVELIMSRLRISTSLREAAATADLVVEAVFEDLAVKQEVFRDLDCLCPPHTVLSSNTSSLMPSTLAAVTKHPERVLVTHYFHPVPLMPLVEVVPHAGTSAGALDTVLTAVRATGMNPVVVRKEVPGFIANRLGFALLREALYLVEEGVATPEEIDTVRRIQARRDPVLGPFAQLDLKGAWATLLAAGGYISPTLNSSAGPSPFVAGLVEKGELGAPVGRGVYDWTPKSAAEANERLTEALIEYLK